MGQFSLKFIIVVVIVLCTVFCNANSLVHTKIHKHRQHTGLRQATFANLVAGTATFTIANFGTITVDQRLAAWLGTDSGEIQITAINTAITTVVQSDTVSVKIEAGNSNYKISVLGNCATGYITKCEEDTQFYSASELNLKGKGADCGLAGLTALQVWYNTLKVFGIVADKLTDQASLARLSPQVNMLKSLLIKTGQSYYAAAGYVPYFNVQPATVAVDFMADDDCSAASIRTWGDGFVCAANNNPCGTDTLRTYFNSKYAIAAAGSAEGATEEAKAAAAAAGAICSAMYSAVIGIPGNFAVPQLWQPLRTAVGTGAANIKKRTCIKKWIAAYADMIKILNTPEGGLAACHITSAAGYAYRSAE